MSDVYQTITDKIVTMIEAGADEWRMPWHGEGLRAPRNPLSGTKYRGINVPMLWAAGEERGFSSALWATYRQWAAAGGQVRKGEKAAPVFFWKKVDNAADDADGKPHSHMIARAYSVFAVEQVDGYELAAAEPSAPLSEDQRIAAADGFFGRIGAIVQHGGGRAFYAPSRDLIQMPDFGKFHEPEAYYSTLGHEHVHWTGAPKRCEREFGKRFADNAYAFEELVAELGAAFLCADLGISNEPRPDHAAYIAGWLAVLKSDKRAIFTAGSKAQAAVDYLTAAAGASLAIAA
jgi:antirestriction protein ArdC